MRYTRHFVSDDPPQFAITQLERAYLGSDGDLGHLSQTLVELDSVWQTPLAKIKTPYEFVISTLRALNIEKPVGGGFMPSFIAVNHLPFSDPSPAGWPDVASHWISPEALMRRVEWARALTARLPRGLKPSWVVENTIAPIATDATLTAITSAPTGADSLALVFLSTEFQRR